MEESAAREARRCFLLQQQADDHGALVMGAGAAISAAHAQLAAADAAIATARSQVASVKSAAEAARVLLFAGTCMHLFATASLGILLATIARSMPQFVLLLFMVLLPMQILSGAGGSSVPRRFPPAD